MAPGPLRQSIEDFIKTTPISAYLQQQWKIHMDRLAEIVKAFDALFRRPASDIMGRLYAIWGASIIYFLLGTDNARDNLHLLSEADLSEDWSGKLADAIDRVTSDPAYRELAETVGALVTEPFMGVLKSYASADDFDPEELYRALQGQGVLTTIASSALEGIVELSTAGLVTNGGQLIEDAYRITGLERLAHHSIMPLMTEGLHAPLSRHYRRLFHTARFGASELRDLYALGQISLGELAEGAREEGWRDGDIDKWVTLAYRQLAQGEIWSAYKKDFIDSAEATKRLRALGYHPDDITLLFKLNPKEETLEMRDTSAATARAAYRKGLIGRDQLREMLYTLKYGAIEVDLIIALEDANTAVQTKDLSVSQIKSAWLDGVLTEAEVRHWLQVASIAPESADILVATWKAESAPVFRKLNSGTIVGAYVEGILTRESAAQKLRSVGYTQDDAALELTLAEVRNPEKFGHPVPTKQKQLAPGTLADLVNLGLISPSAMSQKLIALGYSESDASLLSEAARLKALPTPVKLGERTIERAYLAAVFDRATAKQNLMALDLSDAQAETILLVVEKENPVAFGAPPEVKAKYLTPGILEDLAVHGIISFQEMHDRLLALGYSEDDATKLTDRAFQVSQPIPKILTRNDVLSAYLMAVLDRTTAKNRIVTLGYTEEDAEITLVTFETANPEIFNPGAVQAVRVPAITTLASACQRGILTPDEFIARAQEIGYTSQDAQMYLILATKAEGRPTLELTSSQIIAGYNAGFMPWGQAQTRLENKGYATDDAVLLLRIANDKIVNTQAWYDLLAGNADIFATITALTNAHYADQDILEAFTLLPPNFWPSQQITLDDLRAILSEIPGGA